MRVRRSLRIIVLTVAVAATLCGGPAALHARPASQRTPRAAEEVKKGKSPIRKVGLLDALRLRQLTTTEIVKQVEERGVDFELTADDEAELRNLGAQTVLIEAVRRNFRAAAGANQPAVPSNKQEVSGDKFVGVWVLNGRMSDGIPILHIFILAKGGKVKTVTAAAEEEVIDGAHVSPEFVGVWSQQGDSVYIDLPHQVIKQGKSTYTRPHMSIHLVLKGEVLTGRMVNFEEPKNSLDITLRKIL
jgi:hypothetical protein